MVPRLWHGHLALGLVRDGVAIQLQRAAPLGPTGSLGVQAIGWARRLVDCRDSGTFSCSLLIFTVDPARGGLQHVLVKGKRDYQLSLGDGLEKACLPSDGEMKLRKSRWQFTLDS